MHLLTGDQSAGLRMDAGAGMASHPLLHLEEEPRSRLSCVVHASLASAQNAQVLQYKESAAHDSSSIKYRRYGYAPFAFGINVLLLGFEPVLQPNL